MSKQQQKLELPIDLYTGAVGGIQLFAAFSCGKGDSKQNLST